MHETPFRFSGKWQWNVESETEANLFQKWPNPVISAGKTFILPQKQGRDSTLALPLRQDRSCLLQNCSPAFDHWKLFIRKGRGMLFYCWPTLLMLTSLPQVPHANDKCTPCTEHIAHTYHKIHKTSLLCIYMDTHLPTHTGKCFHFGMFAFSVKVWHGALSLTWFFVVAIILLPAMPGSSVDRLCDLCDGLHGTLAEADMLGRRCKRRSGILRTLFRLIDLNSAQLNLRIAKLCLAVSCLCLRGGQHVSH